jgi:HEAT repeat protein
VRDAAKGTLLGLGSQAVQPLLSFLDDLSTNGHERYETGKEAEGAQAFEEFQGSQSFADKKERVRARQRLTDLDISSRLESDVCEALGRLHAVEAIPVLIALAWSRDAFALSLSFRTYLTSPSIAALLEIGSPAVPDIIKAIQAADAKAAEAFPKQVFGPAIQTWQDLANEIRSTLAQLLGHIGDPAALPVLQTLVENSSDKKVKSYSREAIAEIRRKM